jgi:hypothetical protein
MWGKNATRSITLNNVASKYGGKVSVHDHVQQILRQLETLKPETLTRQRRRAQQNKRHTGTTVSKPAKRRRVDASP